MAQPAYDGRASPTCAPMLGHINYYKIINHLRSSKKMKNGNVKNVNTRHIRSKGDGEGYKCIDDDGAGKEQWRKKRKEIIKGGKEGGVKRVKGEKRLKRKINSNQHSTS